MIYGRHAMFAARSSDGQPSSPSASGAELSALAELRALVSRVLELVDDLEVAQRQLEARRDPN